VNHAPTDGRLHWGRGEPVAQPTTVVVQQGRSSSWAARATKKGVGAMMPMKRVAVVVLAAIAVCVLAVTLAVLLVPGLS
jgi:hypothetical protein